MDFLSNLPNMLKISYLAIVISIAIGCILTTICLVFVLFVPYWITMKTYTFIKKNFTNKLNLTKLSDSNFGTY